MQINEDLAEILGMFAADGCLQEQYICMWGNIVEDKEYYDKVVCPLFSRVFKKEIKAHEKISNSVYGFYFCSKEIVELFKKIGFNNPAQLSKYSVWQKFGMCPAHTTHEERKLILENKRDPFTIGYGNV